MFYNKILAYLQILGNFRGHGHSVGRQHGKSDLSEGRLVFKQCGIFEGNCAVVRYLIKMP